MRRVARLAVVAVVAALPLAAATPASAVCNVLSDPRGLYVAVCADYDPNIDWYCVVAYDRVVFRCPT